MWQVEVVNATLEDATDLLVNAHVYSLPGQAAGKCVKSMSGPDLASRVQSVLSAQSVQPSTIMTWPCLMLQQALNSLNVGTGA